jgi:hypothetical protein
MDTNVLDQLRDHDERLNDHRVRLALLEKSTETIKEGLKSINDGIWKLIWIVAASFVTGIVAFTMSGGFSVGG